MCKLITVFFLSIGIIIFSTIQLIAKNIDNVSPIININRGPGTGASVSPFRPPNFNKFLGLNKGEVVSTLTIGKNMFGEKLFDKKFDVEINNQYSLIIFQTDRLTLGIYIFSKDAECIGYVLMDPFELYSSETEKISNLTPNNNYLQGQRLWASYDKIHESIHDGFIERYGIQLKESYNMQHDILFLDAFYPQELNSIIEPLIVKHLGKSVEYQP